MANAHFMPFNHRPSNTVQGGHGAGYTVPAGKYARAVITLRCSAYVNSFGAIQMGTTGNGTAAIGGTTDAMSQTIEIWLDAGQALTTVVSNASTSVSLTSTANPEGGLCRDNSSATVYVDGTHVSSIRAEAAAWILDTTTTVRSISISGSSDIRWHIEEYDIQT